LNKQDTQHHAERAARRAVKIRGGDFAAYRRRIRNARRLQVLLKTTGPGGVPVAVLLDERRAYGQAAA
jgi:hypothetical protein